MNLHAQMAHAPVVLSAKMRIRRAVEEQGVLDQVEDALGLPAPWERRPIDLGSCAEAYPSGKIMILTILELGELMEVKMKRLFVLVLLSTLVLSSCPAPGGGQNDNGQNNKVLQGNIRSASFTFVSGYAATDSSDSTLWTVNLYKISPASGFNTWQTGAYPTSEYPYLFFSIQKTSSPKTYTITTAGTSPNIGLYAYVGGFNFVAFDSGQLTITKIDKTTNTIAGNITATEIGDTSSLDGSFSVDIDPTSY